jgi:hypothetical protein
MPKTTNTTAHEPSKIDTARSLFAKMKGKSRKDVIQAFVDTVGMTPASASTYYQQFRSGGSPRASGRLTGRAKSKRINGTKVRGQRGRPMDPSSKAGVARGIFKRLSGRGKSRKEIVQAFQSQAKLTPAGASTYYQKFKEAA